MKVLVINEPFVPHFCRSQRWAARSRARAQRHPDWLAYATAVLEKNGEDVELYDFPPKGWGKGILYKLVKEKKPRVVVLDSTTPSIYSDIECAKICKKASNCQIIMVGPHVSALPGEALNMAEGNIDYIARGEYDYTVRDLVRCIREGSEVDIEKIEGIYFMRNNEVIHTPSRPLIENLDELPYPAYHFLDIKDYFDAGKLYPFLTIEGGRGCPFRCSFCLWPQVMHGHKFRLRSAKSIADEIEHWLRRWSQLKRGEFFFEDDTFTASQRHAESICDEIIRRGINITWSINARADLEEPRIFKKMKQAGCRTIWLGIESGDQKILDNCKKGIKVEQVENFIRLAHQAKLTVHGCFVFGLPGETKETIQKTIDFAMRVKPDTLQYSGAVPFPGTEYYDYCEENKLLRAKDWSDWLFRGEQATVVEYPGLSKKEIEYYVDLGLKKFYFRPLYLLDFALKSKNFSDFYRKLKGGWNFFSYLLFARKRK